MIKQYQYNLYIGLTTKNNKKLNFKKSIKIINSVIQPFLSGYTIQNNNIGVWNGSREKSLIITIIESNQIDFIIDYIKKSLCYNLQQYTILATKQIIGVLED